MRDKSSHVPLGRVRARFAKPVEGWFINRSYRVKWIVYGPFPLTFLGLLYKRPYMVNMICLWTLRNAESPTPSLALCR